MISTDPDQIARATLQAANAARRIAVPPGVIIEPGVICEPDAAMGVVIETNGISRHCAGGEFRDGGIAVVRIERATLDGFDPDVQPSVAAAIHGGLVRQSEYEFDDEAFIDALAWALDEAGLYRRTSRGYLEGKAPALVMHGMTRHAFVDVFGSINPEHKLQKLKRALGSAKRRVECNAMKAIALGTLMAGAFLNPKMSGFEPAVEGAMTRNDIGFSSRKVRGRSHETRNAAGRIGGDYGHAA